MNRTEKYNGELRPAAFLDRDGVINRDHGYVYQKENFQWIDGAIEGIRYLNERGYYVFVVTNQSGIARGYYTEEDLGSLHKWIELELARNRARIDRFYYCPHHPAGAVPEHKKSCTCRKPLPGMIHQAFKEWPINKEASFLIGDKESDILAAEAAGIRGYLFTGDNLYNFLQQHVKL